MRYNIQKWGRLGNRLNPTQFEWGGMTTNLFNNNLQNNTQTTSNAVQAENPVQTTTQPTTGIVPSSSGSNLQTSQGNGATMNGVSKMGPIGAIVGMFAGIGEGANKAIAPTNAKGYSEGSDAAVGIAGGFDPKIGYRGAMKDIKTGKVDASTIGNILLPGGPFAIMNNRKRKAEAQELEDKQIGEYKRSMLGSLSGISSGGMSNVSSSQTQQMNAMVSDYATQVRKAGTLEAAFGGYLTPQMLSVSGQAMAKGGFVNPVANETNSLVNYNVGNIHEINPLGGIPLGKSAQGKPNTVEQGETSFKFKEGKYIFSNRLSL